MSLRATKLENGSAAQPRAARSDRFPPGIPYIVGNEGAERFSYYGMRAILKVYMLTLFVRFVDESVVPLEVMAAARAKSTEVVHLFFAGVYAIPLIGAVIADRLLGKYRTIFWVSLIYCAGHAVLAMAGYQGRLRMFEAAELSMYLGLALIAIGSGGIKPCVSANVGDQFTRENGHLVTKVFQIFYFIINYGSFMSTLATPLLLRYFGAEVAFGVPGVLMGMATVIFWAGRNRFIRVPPRPGGKLGLLDTAVTVLLFSPLFALILGFFVLWQDYEKTPGASLAGYFAIYWWLPAAVVAAVALGFFLFGVRQRIQPDRTGFLSVLIYALRNRRQRQPGEGFFEPARRAFGAEAGDGPPAVLRIMLVFSMVSVFWALFDQHASTWVDQAKMMALDLRVPARLGWWVFGGAVVLSIWAGVWLFGWIANKKVGRLATYVVLAAVAAAGALLGGLDLFGPGLGDVVEGGRSSLMTIRMDAAQLQALNPFMVMIIIPALNVLVYAPLGRRGIEIRPLQKMTVGMFLTAIAFSCAALLQMWIERSGKGAVPALWQIGPYFLMTTAEVLVSITGLEFAYTQAPRAMKSTIMGFWLFCVTMGNVLVAFFAPLLKTQELSRFFLLFAGLMAGAAVVFALNAYLYQGKTYLQEAPAQH